MDFTGNSIDGEKLIFRVLYGWRMVGKAVIAFRLTGCGVGHIMGRILFRKRRTFAQLSFDGFLALVVGGIAGVDDCFH